jgi:hypothetical protein
MGVDPPRLKVSLGGADINQAHRVDKQISVVDLKNIVTDKDGDPRDRRPRLR